MLKKLLLGLPLFVFVFVGILLYQQLGKDSRYMPSALIGHTVPDFALISMDSDRIIKKQSLPKGQYLINFWGTWCVACKIEHPYLMELARKGVNIVGIDYKDDKEPAEKWLHTLGNPYSKVLLDELGNFGVDMGVTGAPETFVVDQKGVIVYRHQGVLDSNVWGKIQRYLQ